MSSWSCLLHVGGTASEGVTVGSDVTKNLVDGVPDNTNVHWIECLCLHIHSWVGSLMGSEDVAAGSGIPKAVVAEIPDNMLGYSCLSLMGQSALQLHDSITHKLDLRKVMRKESVSEVHMEQPLQ